MPMPRRRVIAFVAGAAWAVAVAVGLGRLWTYEGTPGAAARPPAAWPDGTTVPRPAREAGRPGLVLLAHPRGPCSRATGAELARLVADCRGRLTATVLVIRPAGVPDGWEQTDLWAAAAAIPGVTVVADPGGVEARRFGAATSGQALLYAADGRLL